MKIRTDFVTNSSSSSFCSIHISGSKLIEILKKYADLFESESFINDEDMNIINITDTEFILSDWEGSGEGPDSKRNIARYIIYLISELSECSENPEEFNDLIEELEDNEKEINKSITSMNWELENTGWGEDEDRFFYDYSDKEIREYMQLEKGIEIDEKIREEFMKKAASSSSISTKTWSFDGKKFKKTFDLDLML